MGDPIIESFLQNLDTYENLDTPKGKHGIKMPSSRRVQLNLSDIIAATIGEELRMSDDLGSCDLHNINFDFLCDDNSDINLNVLEASSNNENILNVNHAANSEQNLDKNPVSQHHESIQGCEPSERGREKKDSNCTLDSSFHLPADFGFGSEINTNTPGKELLPGPTTSSGK